MITRRRAPARVLTDRVSADTMTANRRHIEPGTELTVTGIRGRCAFVRYTRHASGAEWVDVLTTAGRSRTVRPDKIRTVHARHKTGLAR